MLTRSLSFVNLVAIWFETLLYGVYMVLLVATVNVLLFRPFSTRIPSGYAPILNQAYLAGTFALFTLSTVHVAAGLAMLLEAFVLIPEVSSESYFARTASPLNTLRITAFLASISFADAFMIHRVYVLWYRSVVIALVPLFNLVLIVASGVLVSVLSSQEPVPPPLSSSSLTSIEFSRSLTPTLQIVVPLHLAMSFTTNSCITILVGIRLWREGNLTEDGWTWRRVILVVAETGLLYPLTALVALLLSVVETNGQIIPYTALAPLAAILPTLMILLVELGYTTCPPSTPGSRYHRDRPSSATVDLMRTFEKGLQNVAPIITSMPQVSNASRDICQPSESSVEVDCFEATDQALGRSPVTPLPPLSAKHQNLQIPPVPSTPPPVPPVSSLPPGRHRGGPAPLNLSHNSRPDSTPPAPHTPTPKFALPSPFESHFPRHSRFERISQQTFNPRRESAGNGGTAYTTFGSSSLAMMLVREKDSGDKLPLAATLEVPESLGAKKAKGEYGKRDKGNKATPADWDLPPGVYMTKAVERRIDYIEEE